MTQDGAAKPEHRSRWGSGFMWGCLTPLLIVGVLILCGVIYGVYYFTLGYKGDATLQMVLAAVQHDPQAHAVLGDKIDIAGFPTSSFRYDASGHTASYDFDARGSKAEGNIAASCVFIGAHAVIKNLTLTGPDGRVYYLIGTGGSPNTNAVWLLRRQRAGTAHSIPSIAI